MIKDKYSCYHTDTFYIAKADYIKDYNTLVL